MQDIADKITRYLWIASFGGLALFIPFSIAGANISIMLGFLASIIGFITLPQVRARYAKIKKDPMLWGSILLVISAIPSVIISSDFSRAFNDWQSYWILLVYFAVAYNLTSPKLRRAAYWILFSSLTVSCVVSMIQYRGGLDLLFIHIARVEARPSGTLFTMTFAGILAQLIPLNFTMVFRRPFSRGDGLFVFGLIAQIIGLFLTLTRGAWIALFAGLLAATGLLKRKTPYIVMAVVIILIGVVAAKDDRVRNKLATLPQTIRGTSDVNVSTRFVLWDVSWELFKSHPFFGVGMGDFTIEAEKLVADRHVETTVDSHNIYLQILTTRGLFGFVPFVVFWVILFRMLAQTRSALSTGSRFGYHFAMGTIAAGAALLVGALSENNIDDAEVFTTFMFLIGVAKSFTLFPDPHDG